MRILHACRQFYNLTGAELYLYELAREQKAHGHEVVIVTPIAGGELVPRVEAWGVCVQNPTTVEREAIAYDIVHLHHPHCVPPSAMERAGAVVATLHDLADDTQRGPVTRWMKSRREMAKEGLPPDATWAPNPIDLSRFKPAYTLRHTGPPAVLAVGNFRDRRRLPMLHHLVEQAKHKEIRLTLLGQGLHTLRGVVGPTLHIGLPVWDIEYQIAAHDMVASLYFGRAAIEGLLCGRTALIFQEDGQHERIEPTTIDELRHVHHSKRVAQLVERVYEEAVAEKHHKEVTR
jgi:glycosyltransferase involved in cell wall biosynthesis